MRHKDKTLKRIAAIFTRVFTLLITEIFFIIVGLLALYVNLRGTQAQKLTATSAASWDMHDYLAFLGLANAFGGIVDQEAVGKFSVIRAEQRSGVGGACMRKHTFNGSFSAVSKSAYASK